MDEWRDFGRGINKRIYEEALRHQAARKREEEIIKAYEKAVDQRKRKENYYRNKKLDSMIKNVIFNDDVTIVFWDDGTKTVVKCQPGDEYDAEKGLLACMAKKFYGGNGFNRALAKWCPESDWSVNHLVDKVALLNDAIYNSVLSTKDVATWAERMHKAVKNIWPIPQETSEEESDIDNDKELKSE